ncbi:F-box only protein 4 isoform X2 [Python bivittatus]|uniref:F-box only protein 4 isoform X1 n=1 Tax=Python bivittatus TaxID=176946 RepID=A0A9F5IPY9_PYTBI|nr:F-box only protein 4 isoform X1 [Python bivittatus]XP_025021508.1 F-box only protein 4 isoform X2 [Python bivittatus]
MSATHGGDWRALESALRSSLQLLRDKWGPRARLRGNTGGTPGEEEKETAGAAAGPPSALEALPIDVKLYIMSFLTPKDLIYLGSTNLYWRITIQDPLLWRYFLIRDLPSWNSVDRESLPDAKIFNQPFAELDNMGPYNFMAAYKKCCSFHKRCLKPNWPMYGTMPSFLQSLITQAEPRFAMFGPGLEDLDQSLVYKMMGSPEILPLAGMPSRQIHGIGSGVTFHLNGQKFNILTLYSKTSKERQRDKADTNSINKMFYEVSKVDGTTQYNLIEHVQNVCRVADGFIYVADAEAHKRHNRQTEFARMAAMLDPTLGPSTRPLLILSCISNARMERIPCIYLAHQLQLNLVDRPWMVQDTEAATLVGLLDGIQWLLEQIKH